MENELDLTLRLGLPSPTVETHLSLYISNTDQGYNVVHGGRRDDNAGRETHDRRHILRGGDELNVHEGARNHVDVNIRVYNHIFNHFAGIGETLNFSPYPMPLSQPPPETPAANDYVLIDVPARRAHRNSYVLTDTNPKRRHSYGGCSGGRIEATRKCTNINCNAMNTPMWRRGPLGPKTLCNACGIKFRKEVERRNGNN